MKEFNYNTLVYEKQNILSQVTNKKITYFRIKKKYKVIEDLYENITTNMNIYILAEKFNEISVDILLLYRSITSMMAHFDQCPVNYVCFDSVKLILYMIHSFWVKKLSYVIEDRVCLDEEFFLKGNVFAKQNIFHKTCGIEERLKLMKKTFTYKNSIIFINDLKIKIKNFSEHLGKNIKDNRIELYLFKVNDYIEEYNTDYNYNFQSRAAKVIQRAFRKYRYDPQYSFCERVQSNNLMDIYKEYNSE